MNDEAIRTIRNLLAATLFIALPAVVHPAETLHVENNGVDAPTCGANASPCRSISGAIANAAPGDKIIVGPGRYGDLNRNGMLGEVGEENPPPTRFCGCMLLVNKAVSLISSDGAAATVIDAHTVAVNTNAFLSGADIEFGTSGQGFTVTQTDFPSSTLLASRGLAIDAGDVTVMGNQFIGFVELTEQPEVLAGDGIETIAGSGPILVEGNQVMGWGTGIRANTGPGTTVSKNHVSRNEAGIRAFGAHVVGNVVVANRVGAVLEDGASAIDNAVVGNSFTGIFVEFGGAVAIEGNNIFGNRNIGLAQNGNPGLLATNNYWGAETGPGADPADDVLNGGGGTTITTPFATKPFNVDPALKP